MSRDYRRRCAKFCQSLQDYPTQIGMEFSTTSCTCIYPNGRRPSRELLPSKADHSASKFTLTDGNGMALGLRPHVDCASDTDLIIEAQASDPDSPRQQFEMTHDGRVVSVKCPNKVLSPLGFEQRGFGLGIEANNDLTAKVKVQLLGEDKVINLSEGMSMLVLS